MQWGELPPVTIGGLQPQERGLNVSHLIAFALGILTLLAIQNYRAIFTFIRNVIDAVRDITNTQEEEDGDG